MASTEAERKRARDWQRQNRRKHPERYAAQLLYNRQYYPEYYKKNREKIDGIARQRAQNKPFASMLFSVKRRAVKQGLEFSITAAYIEQLWTGVCPVFGSPIELFVGRGQKRDPIKQASLDRIDSSKGYVVGNVQWLSYKANAMKQNATIEELKAFAKWIVSLGLSSNG